MRMRNGFRIIASGCAAFSIAAIFVMAGFGVRAACADHTLTGWSWAGFFRLFSMNCRNEGAGNPAFNPATVANYGIDRVGDELRGFAWSSNLGWMCVGASCGGGGGGCAPGVICGGGDPRAFPPSGQARAVIDPATNAVSGWARVLSIGSDSSGGWVALDCAHARAGAANCLGNAQGVCPGWCAVFDPRRSTLTGWGWNGSGNGAGLGWINFAAALSPAAAYTPWVRTDLGDVYGRQGLRAGSLPPAGEANATFLLQGSGPIDQWITSLNKPANWPANRAWPDPNFDALIFPARANAYRTPLGSLMIEDLVTKVDGNRNRFGQEVVELNDIRAVGNTALGNRVYHLIGDAVINDPLVFVNGDKQSRDDAGHLGGAGLVVIEGTLTVNRDVRYAPSPVSGTILNLASVGWIVRPNPLVAVDPARPLLQFAPTVEQFAGLTYVEGAVHTGDDAAAPHHLTVSGGMIARAFTFARTFIGPADGNHLGSERIIDDGRARANPPPGMTDLSRALPTFKQVP